MLSQPESLSDRVVEDETLARFIVYRKWIRQDKTVKPDAFIPHPYPDLSVTRHDALADAALWRYGQAIAEKRQLSGHTGAWHGRADIVAADVIRQQLRVNAAATPDNPYHAIIVGWDKESQKMKALEMAAKASFVPAPYADS